jgi:hypothetical protein
MRVVLRITPRGSVTTSNANFGYDATTFITIFPQINARTETKVDMPDIVIGSIILGICSILATAVHGCCQIRWKRKEKILDAVIEMHRNALGYGNSDPVRKEVLREQLNDYIAITEKLNNIF